MDYVEGPKRLGIVDTRKRNKENKTKKTPLYRERKTQVVAFGLRNSYFDLKLKNKTKKTNKVIKV